MTARRMSLPAIVLTVICTGWTMRTDAGSIQTPASPPPQTPEALAKQRGCLECHALDTKVIGPAFRDIAARYRDSTGARDYLIQVVKRGGKGKWTDVTGGVPMPPHSYSLSDAEVQRLVDWVLGLGR
jgi:cytochrome c